jgi:hypothetical protein
MNPVVHFELPYENAERASAFYRAASGGGPNSLVRRWATTSS